MNDGFYVQSINSIYQSISYIHSFILLHCEA